MNTSDRFTRRGSLVRFGGLAAAAAGVTGWAAEHAGAGDGPAGVASGAVSCVLTPELTEGPYYIDGEKVRQARRVAPPPPRRRRRLDMQGRPGRHRGHLALRRRRPVL